MSKSRKFGFKWRVNDGQNFVATPYSKNIIIKGYYGSNYSCPNGKFHSKLFSTVEAIQHRRNIRVKRKSFSLAFRKLFIFASSDFRYPTVSIASFTGGGGKNLATGIWSPQPQLSSGGSGNSFGSDIIMGGGKISNSFWNCFFKNARVDYSQRFILAINFFIESGQLIFSAEICSKTP